MQKNSIGIQFFMAIHFIASFQWSNWRTKTQVLFTGKLRSHNFHHW